MHRAAHRPLARAAIAAAAVGPMTVAMNGCTPSGTAPMQRGMLAVFAAASLTTVFTELAGEFEADHPGVEVQLNLTGSPTLVEQIVEGAPADVFASADEANMTKLTDEGLIAGAPTLFATNTLQIVVPAGNPARVTGLADLADPHLRVVICAPEVPCGAATAAVEEAADVVISRDSEEEAVTDVLAKVTSGEADAGVVYVTDVIGAGDEVEGVDIAEADAVVNRYPIGVVDGAAQPGLAQQWIDLVLSADGRAALQAAGFGAP